MDWTAIITTTVTVVGGIITAYIGILVKRHSEKNDEILNKINRLEEQTQFNKAKLEALSLELEDNNLRTLRLDLLHAIETDPGNTLVILDLAQKYFVEMKGNCYMSKVFQEWATDHNVNVTSIFNKG